MIYPKGISGGGDVFINGNTVYHSANINTQVYDWNTYTPAPFKSAEATVANAPTTGEYYYGTSLRFHRSSDTYFADIVSGLYSDRLFYRRHDDTGYKNWLEIYHTGNLAPVTLNTEQYITANKTFVGGINGFVKQASKANPTEQPVFINGTGGATLGESAAIGFHNPGRNYSSIVYHDGLFKFMNSVMGGYNGIIASTGNFTNLTANYIPKHSASGLTNSLIYDNGTNVSIGEQNSGVLFNVVGYTTYPVARFAQGSAWNDTNYALYVDGYSYLNGFRINGDDPQRGLYAKSNRQLGFATEAAAITFTTQASAERMRITANGDVGIGTTNPTNRLTVSKSLGTSDYASVAQYD